MRAVSWGFITNAFEGLPQSSSLSNERIETLIPRLKDELSQKGAYYPLRVIWGQKPLHVD